MKRSKIFLGVTTGLLAVAAVMAAKVSKFSPTTPAYYSHNNGPCTRFASIKLTTRSDGKPQDKASNNALLFSYNASTCTKKLYTEPE